MHMKPSSKMFGPLVLILSAAGCASAPAPSVPAPVPVSTDGAGVAEPQGQQEVVRAAGGDAFPLRPGDVIRLRIWREPDLTGEFAIDEGGVVVLPKIGAVAAADHTPADIERVVREEYAKYLRNPSIEIVLLRRINILGAVRAPGLYPVDPTMTVRDALALAGGVLSQGQQDRVEIFRGENRLVSAVHRETRVADLGLRSGDQLYVPERAWVSRNAGVIAGVASTLLSVAASLIIAFRN